MVDLYGGRFLDQFFLSDSAAFEEWALLTRERLHRRALRALIHLADYHERRAAYDQAQQPVWRLLELDPWREASHRQLMRVLALGGQRSAALMQYATCRRILADELGVAPEEETTALYTRIQRGADVASPGAARPADNLAAHTPPTPLIGRDTELVQIADRLEQRDCRLLTLVGPGGIGKTRLALQAAADLHMSFRDGVTFVALAPLHAAEFVAPAIAGALGFVFHGPADPKAQLLAYLRAKDMLLVLDNVEQMLDAAPLISELLATNPDLTILATGRSPLHVRGEHQFPVPPLRLPDLAQLPDVRRLTQYAAVALFVARAQAVQPAFQMTAVTAPTVAMICTRLDGLPLAIELAAARSNLFPPAALLARLHSPLAVLTGGAHNLPARQQTIRATIDWSYHLLDAGEQRLFARLAVFVGGCTVEAVEAVCADVGLSEIGSDNPTSTIQNMLDGLASLLDKNLLQYIEEPDGEPRFVLLETIRAYALERLDMSGEAEAVRRQHTDYYLALAEAAAPQLHGAEQRVWLDRLDAEHGNLRAALAWSQTLPSGADVGLRLAGALWLFWFLHGHVSEGRKWAATVLVREVKTLAVRAKALIGAGYLAFHQADYVVAHTHFEESLALFRKVGDKAGVAAALRGLGGKTQLEESLALYRELGDKSGSAGALRLLAEAARDRDEPVQALALLAETLILRQDLGDTLGFAYALNTVGDVAHNQGDYTQAIARYQESAILFRALGSKGGLAWSLYNLGRVTLDAGDTAQALVLLTESVTLFHEQGYKAGIAHCLKEVAVAISAQAQPERAARLLGAVDALWEMSGYRLTTAERANYDRDVAAVRIQPESAIAIDSTFAGTCGMGESVPGPAPFPRGRTRRRSADAPRHMPPFVMIRPLPCQRGIRRS